MSIFSTALPTPASANNVAQALLPATAKANAATSSSSTSSSASTTGSTSDITSNDFLTLLVTEMQNQDPTQPTDPNAYIQQLVGVNSLQQLIAINQGLGGIETSSTSSSTPVTAAAASTAAVTGLTSTPSVTNGN